MQKQGYDLFAAQDFLAKNGHPYFDDELFKRNYKSKNYRNPLYVAPSEQTISSKPTKKSSTQAAATPATTVKSKLIQQV